MTQGQNKFITVEKVTWLLITTIIAIITYFVSFYVKSTDQRINKIEKQQEKINECITDVKINTSLTIQKLEIIEKRIK